LTIEGHFPRSQLRQRVLLHGQLERHAEPLGGIYRDLMPHEPLSSWCVQEERKAPTMPEQWRPTRLSRDPDLQADFAALLGVVGLDPLDTGGLIAPAVATQMFYRMRGGESQDLSVDRKPSGGGTGKSRTKPLNHQLGDVRLKVLSMS
jgi:hypothetical protein